MGFVKDTAPTGILPGPAGINQTWDLSAIVPEDSTANIFIDPAGAAGTSNFPNASLALPDSVNNGNSFFSLSSSKFDLLGGYGNFGLGTMAIKYIPSETWLSLPSNYQSTFSGTTKYEIAVPYSSPPIDSVKIKSTIIYTSIIDAWGSITTPDYSNINCLRQKFTEISIDSTFAHYLNIWVSAGTPTVDTTISYRWWSNEAKLFIAEVVTDQLGAVSSASYLINYCTISVNASSTNESGFNFNDGTASVVATGGFTPYSYQWSNGNQTSGMDSLSPGNYSVSVTDGINCSVSDTVVIAPYVCSFSVSAAASNESSFNGNDGFAFAVTTGGNSPFTYEWSNDSNTAYISGLSPGNYFVTVTDNKGCIDTSSTLVKEYLCAFSISASSTNESTQGANDGTASVSGSGGATPFSYLWSNNGSASSISNLSPGIYSVIVTDGANCVAEDSVIVNGGGCNLQFDSVITTNISCFGASNGNVSIFLSGGSTPYSYNWSNGSMQPQIINLIPKNYSVTVSDGGNCFKDSSFFISEPAPLSISMSATSALCFGNHNGTASASIAGGTTPYSYLWCSCASGQTSPTATGLGAGNYSVSVSDANSCSINSNIVISQPDTLIVNITTNPAGCGSNCNGSALSVVSGGTPPFEYFWNTGDGEASVDSLCVGNYSIDILDSNGCTGNNSANIIQASPLQLSIIHPGVVLCEGDTSWLSVSVSGGSSPYSYLWSNGGISSSITVTSSQQYSVTVTDVPGCSGMASGNHPYNSKPSLTFTQTNTSCYGVCDATTSPIASGGTSPFSYSWDNPCLSCPMFTNICEGFHLYTINDSNGCTDTASVFINSPLALKYSLSINNVSCSGECDGNVEVFPSGGISPYSYNWSTGSQNPPTCAGAYTVTVTDANNCSADSSILIVEPEKLVLILSFTPDSGNSSGTALASPNGGTKPYTWLWNTTPPQTDSTATGLAQGNYFVTVTDSHACVELDSVYVPAFTGSTPYFHSANSQFSVFPNPLSEKLFLFINVELPGNLKILLINSLGEEIVLLNKIIESGSQVLHFETSNLPAGIYYLKVWSASGFSEYHRISKL